MVLSGVLLIATLLAIQPVSPESVHAHGRGGGHCLRVSVTTWANYRASPGPDVPGTSHGWGAISSDQCCRALISLVPLSSAHTRVSMPRLLRCRLLALGLGR